MSFFLEHPNFCLQLFVHVTGGPWILHTNGSNPSIYIEFGAVVAVLAVQVFLILILSVFARHTNLIL